MQSFFERYLIELILLGGFFLTGPLARIIADRGDEESREAKHLSQMAVRRAFRLLFAALLALWLLLFKGLFPLLYNESVLFLQPTPSSYGLRCSRQYSLTNHGTGSAFHAQDRSVLHARNKSEFLCYGKIRKGLYL